MLSKVATDLDYIKVQDYIQYKNINISSEKTSFSFSMAALLIPKLHLGFY